MLNSAVIGVLNKLNDDEIIGLVNTVTQGLLKQKIGSRSEAIHAILKYSSDEVTLLRRRCITRDILFEYAHENNIQVNLPITKPELIERICSFWNVGTKNSQTYIHSISNEQKNSTNTVDQNITIQSQETKEPNSISVMAEQFTAWFYNMMNQPYPIGKEHFWNDAQLTVNIFGQNDLVTEKAEGNTSEIVNLLFRIRQENNLFLNPNLMEEGVQGRIDPHGLVVILACGTLHSSNNCVGVFEQVFMLARDPNAENNWKIKKTQLNLRNKSVHDTPKLTDTNLTNSLLQLPSS